MTLQITIARIEGYGPWTLSLGSDREAQLQMLQSKIYFDIQRLFSERGGLVYSNRFDEYIAVTNGISDGDHVIIQKEMGKIYPNLNISMTIGRGRTAFEANKDAHLARKEKIFLKNPEINIYGRAEKKKSSSGPDFEPQESEEEYVQILHVDIDGSTKVSNNLSPYEITVLVVKLYSRLAEELLEKGCMTFFLGGDNFMVISNGLLKIDIEQILSNLKLDIDIKLNCGVGISKTARKAAEAATRALDTIRELRDEGKILPVYEIQI